MKQRTATSLFEALKWIQENQHHEVGLEYSDNMEWVTHRWFRGHHAKLRVPTTAPWFQSFINKITPQTRPHDDRMYKLTDYGRRVLRNSEYGRQLDWVLHP